MRRARHKASHWHHTHFAGRSSAPRAGEDRPGAWGTACVELWGNSNAVLQAWDSRGELLPDHSCPKGLCKELGGWLTAWERSRSKAEGNNFSSSGVVLMFYMHFFSLNEGVNFKWKSSKMDQISTFELLKHCLSNFLYFISMLVFAMPCILSYEWV